MAFALEEETVEPKTTLFTIRQQYPMYGELPDEELATRLYDKHYSVQLPKEQFFVKIGYSPDVNRQALGNEQTANLQQKYHQQKVQQWEAAGRPGPIPQAPDVAQSQDYGKSGLERFGSRIVEEVEKPSASENWLGTGYRAVMGGKVIDPYASAEAGETVYLSQEDIQKQQNEKRDRLYGTAPADTPKDLWDEAGQIVGVIANESVDPIALQLAPIGGTATGLVRVGKLAGAGGLYEMQAAIAEQMHKHGEVTDWEEVATRSGMGAVGAPVLDKLFRVAAKGIGKGFVKGKEVITGKKAVEPPEQLYTPDEIRQTEVRSQGVEEPVPSPKEGPVIDIPKGAVESRVDMTPGGKYKGNLESSVRGYADGSKKGFKPHEGPVRGVTRREDILKPFLKALDVPLYEGRIKKGSSTLGYYLPKHEAVRVKHANDIEVAAHELAHLIDDRVFHGFKYGRTKGQKSLRPWAKDQELSNELKSVSYDETKPYEGFAEFVRHYMTNKNTAQQAAPKFYDWMEKFVAGQAPGLEKQGAKYGPAIRQAQEGMHDWFAQSSLEQGMSKVRPQHGMREKMAKFMGRDPEPGLYTHPDPAGDKFRQNVVDDMHGVMRMERDAYGDTINGGAYETMRLTRGSSAVFDGAIEHGAPKMRANGDVEFTGKGLNDILAPVEHDLDNFMAYAIGRRAVQLKKESRENLFTANQIKAFLELESPVFRRAFEGYQEWNLGILKFAQDTGLLSANQVRELSKYDYVPFYRYGQKGAGSKNKGIEGYAVPLKRLTGGTQNLRPILGNIMENAHRLIAESLKNQARRTVVDQLSRVRGGGRYFTKIPKETHAVRVDKDQIVGKLTSTGVDPDQANGVVALMGRMDEDFVNFWTFGHAPKGDNVIAVMRKGKPTFYEVEDELLYRSMQSLQRKPQDMVTKILGLPKRVGQNLITLMPDFMIPNFFRDTLTSGVMGHAGMVKGFTRVFSGMKSRITKDQDYQDFIANGGGMSSIYRDEADLRRSLEKWYTNKGVNPAKVWLNPINWVDGLKKIGEVIEQGNRIGEFKIARGQGDSAKHAAYRGREISTDFSVQGDNRAAVFMYDTVMFLRAAVNSADRLYRGLRYDPHQNAMTAKIFGLAGVSATLAYLNNNDKWSPLYRDLPDWDKDGHWHIFLPNYDAAPNAPLADRYHHFRLPKIWEIGAVSSIAERTVELFDSEDSDITQFSKHFHEILSNVLHFNVIPQAVVPLADIATNELGFTSAPIEPKGSDRVEPWARYSSKTSETSKWVGENIMRKLPREAQLSPARLDALVRGYLNTLGMYGLMASDEAFFRDQKAALRFDELPVVRRFYTQHPALRSRYTEFFYEMLESAKQAQGTINLMAPLEGKEGIVDEIIDSERFYMEPGLSDFNSAIAEINQMIRAVRNDPRLTPEQKRDQRDSLIAERNELMKEAVLKFDPKKAN